ncbi:MAG: hypothetical protein AB1742_15270 [bacterium]
MKYIPPLITGVQHEPSEPDVDEDIEVAARIEEIKFSPDSINYVDEAFLYYSMDDGETWEEVEMYQSDDDESIWTGEIPAMGEDCEIVYRITATDSEGNKAIEMPFPVIEREGEEPAGDDESGSSSDLAPVDLEEVMGDEDDPEREIPSYLDILSLRFGYTDEEYIFRVTFEDAPTPGTVSPIDANGYAVVLINSRPVISPDIARHAWAWYYAPAADIAPAHPDFGKIPPVALVHANPENLRRPIFETEGFDYTMDGNVLNLGINREFLAESLSDTVVLAAGNARVTGSDFFHLNFAMGDITRPAVVYMRGHTITVGRPPENDEGE